MTCKEEAVKMLKKNDMYLKSFQKLTRYIVAILLFMIVKRKIGGRVYAFDKN